MARPRLFGPGLKLLMKDSSGMEVPMAPADDLDLGIGQAAGVCHGRRRGVVLVFASPDDRSRRPMRADWHLWELQAC
jgi:hypothetical protein